MNKQSGIYQIRNLVNNKIYIGSAINLENRKRSHLHYVKNQKHHSKYFQKSFNKYGEENFVFEILELVGDESKLIQREQYYIDTLKPQYNICRVAGSLLGTKRTDEQRKKMSQIALSKKRKLSEDQRKLISKRLTGVPRSKEAKESISKGRKGIVFSESHRANISKNNARRGKPGTWLGRSHTKESNMKNSESQKTMPKKTCIYCGKIASPSKIARWHDNHCLQNPNIDIEKETLSRVVSKELRKKRAIGISKSKQTIEFKQKRKANYEKREPFKCQHCSFQSKNAANISKWHNDNCKFNPLFDKEAHEAKLKAWKDKLKAAKKTLPTITCPHCNYSSKNKGNIVRNHFNNCKNKTVIY